MDTAQSVAFAFTAYSRAAHAFATYADERYPYAGLIAEVGELFDLRAKTWRGDYGDPAEAAARLADAQRDELGDVAWFINEIAIAHGLTVVDLVASNMFQLDTYADTRGRLLDAALDVYNEVVRDGRDAFIVSTLARVLGLWVVELDRCELDATDVLAGNLAKLTARRDRGQIKGAGHGAARRSHLYATAEEMLAAGNALSAEALDYLEVFFMHALDLHDDVKAELARAAFIDDQGHPTAEGRAVSRMIFG